MVRAGDDENANLRAPRPAGARIAPQLHPRFATNACKTAPCRGNNESARED